MKKQTGQQDQVKLHKTMIDAMEEIVEFEKRGTPAGDQEIIEALKLREEITIAQGMLSLLRHGRLIVAEKNADGEAQFARADDRNSCSTEVYKSVKPCPQ